MAQKYNVNVLGAGVSGLTTALTLLEKGKYNVKVIATHIPSDLSIDYTSPWAGAYWRSFADNADIKQQDFDTETYHHLAYLAENEPKACIMFTTGHEFWDSKPKNFEDPWFKRILKNYQHIPKEELPPGIGFGIRYTTVTLNSPKYLLYLQERILALGGTIERGTVPSLKALAQIPHHNNKKADIIVNCSALGSRSLGGVHDHHMFPTRGQIEIVRIPNELWSEAKKFTMLKEGEEVTYVIPRENGEIILGGTQQHWNYQEVACEKTSQGILSRVRSIRPDLFSKATVLRTCVGLRPSRQGGVRVSAAVEQLDWNEGWNPAVLIVAHNYGHGGFGYQSSTGCANKTVQLIEQHLAELENVKRQSKTMSKL